MPLNFSSISTGVAKAITSQPLVQAAMNISSQMSSRPDADGIVESFFNTFTLGKVAGGPPYPNVLEEFASYTPLWTLACLEPNQYNNPNSYRGNKAALKHVIFSSAGRFGAERTVTAGGQPEYFVNNFDLNARTAQSNTGGNSNILQLEFDVYEPYSMGYFIESLQAAAIGAGYANYNGTPFLLMLEFYGHKDNGEMFANTELLTKYFPINFIEVKFNVTEGGSNYKCKCIPANHSGWAATAQQIPNDMTLRGSSVEEMLTSGQVSLCGTLNAQQLKLQQENKLLYPDEYLVVFPAEWNDPVGLPTDIGPRIDAPVVNLPYTEGETAGKGPRPGKYTGSYGLGPVGAADLDFGPTTGGNYNFGFESDVVDEATGIINRDKLKIDPSQRTFTFPPGTTVQNIIQQVILSSKYAKDAINPQNMDDAGMISWFRVDVQVELGEFDPIRNERQKRYIFRAMPFYVHNSIFRNPTAAPPGYVEVNKKIAKEYNYIYTGKNNDLLKFDIQINNLFNMGRSKTSPEDSASIANPDLHQSAEDPDQKVKANVGDNPASVAVEGSSPAKLDPNITKNPIKGGYGAETVAQKVALMFQNSLLSQGSDGDLLNIDIEILGDPYFIIDAGMGNYIGDVYQSPKDQITSDSTMNYQGTDCYIRILFRNPIEPELESVSEYGLYKFAPGQTVNRYSGIYKVLECKNRFSDGVFKQVLKCNRMPNQPQDYEGIPGQNKVTPPAKSSAYDLSEPDDVPYGPF
jgi:hypothetical protein